MSQEEVLYEELEQWIIEELKKHKICVLATSENNRVYARGLKLCTDGLTLYCSSQADSKKFKQIQVNPNVAVAAGNLQIEGIASLTGHPLGEANVRYIEVLKEHYPEDYQALSAVQFKRPEYTVIKINPVKITMYKGGNKETGTESSLNILNVAKKEAYKVYRSDMSKSPAYNE